MSKLILASASPRRKELLEQVGALFEIIPARGEEIITKEKPHEVVMELALQKAGEVAKYLNMVKDASTRENEYMQDKKAIMANEETIILGADTMVVYGGRILGKPKDKSDAVRMLTQLSGNTHSVYTGVAIIQKINGAEHISNFYEETKVTMYPVSQGEIEAYVETKEPMDKAGAYGVQGKGAIYIERIAGDYNNVVGLPIARIYQEMSKLGIAIYSNP